MRSLAFWSLALLPCLFTARFAFAQVAVTVSPTAATVQTGATVQFSVAVTGSPNNNVSWSVNGTPNGNATVGTITNGGLYTAPSVVPNPSIVTVTATSQADATKSAGATVTISPPPQVIVTVSPITASVQPGATLQLTATVSNAAVATVNWSANGTPNGNGTVGTITSAGLYTAPGTVPSPSVVVITAISQADNTKTASASVTVTAPGTSGQTLAAPIVAQPYADETIIAGTGTPNAIVTIQIGHVGAALVPVKSATGGAVTVNSDGTFEFPLTDSLQEHDAITVTLALNGNTGAAYAVARKPSGLVGLMLGGAVFSQQNGNFSQSAPFFGFITGYRWHDPGDINKEPTDPQKKAKWKPRPWLNGSDLNLRFQGIFTLSPQAASCSVTQTTEMMTGSTTTPNTATSNCSQSSSSGTNILPQNFLTSQKAFDMNVHAWWGFLASRDVEVGPYLALGLNAPLNATVPNTPANGTSSSTTSSTTTTITTTTTTTSSSLVSTGAKPYFEIGTLAEFAFGGEGPTPKLYMQSVLAYGNYQQLAAAKQISRNRALFRMAVFPSGLSLLFGKQVELSPMFGVDINYGHGASNVRFFTGAAVNLRPFQKFTAPSP